MRKWIGSLVGAVLFILSLAEVPDQFRAWRDWMSPMTDELTGDTIRWLLGIIGLLLVLWVNDVHKRLFSVPPAPTRYRPFLAWRPTPQVIASLRELKNEHTNLDVTFFDQKHLPFAQRLASAFEAAGWVVGFNETAQGFYNPYHFGGIKVNGDNRYFVERIVSVLDGSGCSMVKPEIVPASIQPSHPKYARAKHKVWITIGFEDFEE